MSRRDDRLLELLASQATQGLDVPEQAELQSFCRAEANGVGSLERAAAAIDVAFLDAVAMPNAVRSRVAARLEVAIRDGSEVAMRDGTSEVGARVVPIRPPAQGAPPEPPTSSAGGTGVGRLGWLAAAAALVLAVLGWWPRSEDIPLGPAGLPPSIEERRADLVSSEPGVVRIAWTATEDPASTGATGDVVWSGERQAGFMRFRGLAANDPNVEQYQLWIFDEAQDERFPVDGGVFDMTAAGEVVVPIDAKIRVDRPTLFAVTVERPGGVVVSGRERIVLLASIG